MTSNLETTLNRHFNNLDVFLIFYKPHDGYFVFKSKSDPRCFQRGKINITITFTLKEFLLKLESESFEYKTTLVFTIVMYHQRHWNVINKIRGAIHHNPCLRNKQKVFMYWYSDWGMEPLSIVRERYTLHDINQLNESDTIKLLIPNHRSLDNEIEFYTKNGNNIPEVNAYFVQQGFLKAWNSMPVFGENILFIESHVDKLHIPAYFGTLDKNAGFYCYALNPSLSIIINHDTFDSPRKGSEHDLINLYNAFTRKDIQQVILKDGSLKEVEFFSKMFRKTNFSGLKYLFVVINSHGKEGDIIRASETEKYNLRDMILKPIFRNSSLKGVMKIILVSACRGEKEGTEHNYNETIGPAVESNDFSFMDNNTVVVYSSANGYRSYRFPESGSHFIKIFCEKFGENWDELDLSQLTQNMNNALEIYTSSDELKPTQHCQLTTLDKGYKIKFEKSNDLKLRKTVLTIKQKVKGTNPNLPIPVDRREVLKKPIIKKT